MVLVHHTLLLVAAAALASGAWRIALATGARGAVAALAAAPVAAAVAVASALGLGLAGLGGSTVALLLAALAFAGAAHVLTPTPSTRLALPVLGPRERLLAGAGAAAALAWFAWILRYPALGIDPVSYHLPESILWIQRGSPGAVELVEYEWPVGAYPVTNEVLVGWIMGLGHSMVSSLLWVPLTALLFGLAGWVGLRALAVPVLARCLAVGAVLLVPIAVTQLWGAHTDLPALAWLLTTAALCACARERPVLLAPALLAAALGVGTKTTIAPLALVALAAAAWPLRRELPGVARPLAAAAVLGVAVGGTWYLRNWIEHGSPLWPFIATPWGDPIPHFLDIFDTSFLENVSGSLEGRTGTYVDVLGGAIPLIALALLAPLVVRTRAVLAGAGATLFGLLTWLNAPFTGAPADPVFDLSFTTTRYLLPTACAAALTLGLAARQRPRLAAGALACCVLLSLERSQALRFPGMPSLGLLAVAAGLGAGLAYAAGRLRRLPPLPLAAGATAVAGVLVVTAAADGIARRHGAIGRLHSSGVVTWFAQQRDWREGDAPIAFGPQMLAPLAGDTLRHPIAMIPHDEPCEDVLRRAREGWVVIGTPPFSERRAPFSARGCLERLPTVYRDAHFRVYRLRQTATRSKPSSARSASRKKSSARISAIRGSTSPRVRARVSSAS